jgi:hypothetical protein
LKSLSTLSWLRWRRLDSCLFQPSRRINKSWSSIVSACINFDIESILKRACCCCCCCCLKLWWFVMRRIAGIWRTDKGFEARKSIGRSSN